MSKQAQQRTRLALYRELSEIVTAMKNMAEVELHRTTRIERNQQQTLATTQTALTLLLQAQPQVAPTASPWSVLIVLGSQRGFCGGFNEQLARALEREQDSFDEILIIGGRLAAKLAPTPQMLRFPGPATADEVLPCVEQFLDHLLQRPLPFGLNVLAHGLHGVERQVLLPCREQPEVTPCVNLDLLCPPQPLFERLQWQYLHQGLFQALLGSLRMENRMRLQQMEGAREHLEGLINDLRLRLNSLRQQEIIEELEMILVDQEDRHGLA